MSKLRTVLDLLLAGTTLPAAYNDHPLKGEGEELRLARTGTHSDLFDE